MANFSFTSAQNAVLYCPLPVYYTISGGTTINTLYESTPANLQLTFYSSSGTTYLTDPVSSFPQIIPPYINPITATVIGNFLRVVIPSEYVASLGGLCSLQLSKVATGETTGVTFQWGSTYDTIVDGATAANNLPDGGALTSIGTATAATNTTLTGPAGTVYGLVEDARSAATKTYNFSQQLEGHQFLRTADTPSFVIPGFLDYDGTTVSPLAVPTTTVASAATGAPYLHTVTPILGNTAWRVVVTDPLTPADAGLFVLVFEVPSAISGSLETRVPFYWGEGLPVDTFRLMGNKVTTNFAVTPPVMTVYADDGTTPLYTRTLANGDGSAVNPAQILELSQYT